MESDGTFIKNTIIENPAMKKIYQKARILSYNRASVLITGESGVGKSHLANYIRSSGIYKGKPFISVNCSAVSDELFSSELFGYSPNAFTGASEKGKTGLLESANHGTILFDEINELSPQNQVLLLHFLQNRTVTPLGSLQSIDIDTRVICTSGRNLKEMIAAGEFRADLYYRLRVADIFIPPLRERREEIPLFLSHFLDYYEGIYRTPHENSAITDQQMQTLCGLPWRGNLREVENLAQQICLAQSGKDIINAHIRLEGSENFLPPDELQAASPAAETLQKSTVPIRPLRDAVRDFECEYIRSAVENTRTLHEAAEKLGISFSSLCRKKAEYKIHKSCPR
jgi:transcriptional regulator with PAS, ATPase and Fis domain